MADPIVEVEIVVPKPVIPENLAKYLEFTACFRFWLDNEPRLAAPASRQVVCHRVLTRLEEANGVMRLRERDWKLVCDLLEDSQVDFVPTLEARNEAGEVVDKVTIPNALGRAYIAAILEAKPVEQPQPEQKA